MATSGTAGCTPGFIRWRKSSVLKYISFYDAEGHSWTVRAILLVEVGGSHFRGLPFSKHVRDQVQPPNFLMHRIKHSIATPSLSNVRGRGKNCGQCTSIESTAFLGDEMCTHQREYCVAATAWKLRNTFLGTRIVP
jgi:hypothetical protein